MIITIADWIVNGVLIIIGLFFSIGLISGIIQAINNWRFDKYIMERDSSMELIMRRLKKLENKK